METLRKLLLSVTGAAMVVIGAALPVSALTGPTLGPEGESPVLARPSAPAAPSQVPGTGLVVDVGGTILGCGLNPGDCLGDAAGAVTGVVDDAVGGVIEDWRKAGAGGVQVLMNEVTGWMASTTVLPVSVDSDGIPEQEWFQGWWWQMVAVSILIMVPLMLFAMIDGLRKGTTRYAIRAAFGPVAAIFTSILVIVFAYAFSTLVSGLAEQWTGNLGSSPTGDSTSIYEALTSTDLNVFVAILFAVFLVVALLILAVEMIGINAGLILGCLFMPLAAAGVVWDKTDAWIKKVTAAVFGLLVAKLVIFAILGITSSVLANAVQGEGSPGMNEILAVLVMLLLAVFSPMAVMRFVGPDGGTSGAGMAATGMLGAAAGLAGFKAASTLGGAASGGGGAMMAGAGGASAGPVPIAGGGGGGSSSGGGSAGGPGPGTGGGGPRSSSAAVPTSGSGTSSSSGGSGQGSGSGGSAPVPTQGGGGSSAGASPPAPSSAPPPPPSSAPSTGSPPSPPTAPSRPSGNEAEGPF